MRVCVLFSLATLVGCGAADDGDLRPTGGADSPASVPASAIDTLVQPDSADSARAARPPADPPCLASRIGLPCSDP